ncbi:ATP-binding protein [Phenylobacterium sp.]|jgi:signal transduction histidine kinase|uniref:ATP-binding protein n=1 Tax=Phenylobacterium sp. TaxID=1871053 RepID=UPI002F92A7D2
MGVGDAGAGEGHRAFEPRGLERRFVAAALLATVTALVACFSLYQWTNWSRDRTALAVGAGQLASALAHDARAAAAGDPAAAVEVGAALYAAPQVAAVSYTPLEGEPFTVGAFDPRSPLLRPSGATEPRQVYRSPGVVAYAPVFDDGRKVGELVLLVDDHGIIVDRLRNIAIALILSLLATAGAGLMAQRLARRALAPLRALNEAMEAATQSRDFTARAAIGRHDEVGQLTRNFNRLLAALETYDASLNGALVEATVARDAAEQANALKSQFLANMSHELRTPLNGVLGMAQILLLDELTPVQRERVETIDSSGRALLSVLSDILDLSAIESGRMALASEAFDLESVLDEAVTAARALEMSERLTLSMSVSPQARGGWIGDAARVRQILFHLTANALKFTEAGAVHVSAARGLKGELTLTVADTGPGIAPERLSRLFESFVQGDGAATRRVGGAGLGLTICRELCALMGGRIEVESTLGRGSVFTVTLKLKRARAKLREAPSPAAAADADAPRPLRVLVAEDNQTNQMVVKSVLQAMGAEPSVVDDGQLAVEAWQVGGYDLILMDIQMPVMDGVEATREIRRQERKRRLPRTPILALTANVLPHQQIEYRAAGVDGVLAKPIQLPELQAALEGARARRAA